MSQNNFTQQCMAETEFHDVNLQNAVFENVNLSGATFENINLSGATFRDVKFANVTIDESCVDGLVIWGFNIRELIEAEQKRRAAAG
jgi:uncharacterized protein YjbI with pentapeptide repeats